MTGARAADPLLYRPNVGLAIFNRNGLVFLGRRAHLPRDAEFAWQMPQGGMDEGETPQQAALRELEEETGLSPKLVEILGEMNDWLYYDFPPAVRENQSGPYLGQRQKWFALRFIGEDADIRLDGHAREFSDWRWATLDEAIALVIPWKRAVYEAAARALRRFEAGARE